MENKVDWVSVLLFAAIILFGWINVYAACYDESHAAVFDFSTKHCKQILWIGLSLFFAFGIMLIKPRLFYNTAFIIYLITLVMLVVTLLVGKITKGGVSWIDFGFFKLQPSEFAKFGTAIALAKYLSSPDIDYSQLRTKIAVWTIILIPAALILLQHDTGSALVFASFLLPLYREGMSPKILVTGLVAVALFVAALLINKYILIGILALVMLFYLFVWLNKRSRKHYILAASLFVAASLFTVSVDILFENVLQSHQRDRIYVLLGKTEDVSDVGYNVHQSKIAVGSGGLTGKGFLNGTLTKANFVPEQETDFIFCTVGEEWGFAGSILLVAAYIGLLLRIIRLAERQYSRFARFYGYSVASILFMHVLINIGMVLGLVPVIGIPLPFFSYGGSSMMAFTILFFVFLRQDQERTRSI